MNQSERLYLLDGMALVYRAYYSFIGRPLRNSRGQNTSAAYGFATTLMKVLDDGKPDHIAVVFDTKEPTFRHEMYPEYKATRESMPEDMVPQLGWIKEIVRAFRTPLLELPGFEADDIIGTLARRAAESNLIACIVTADKDMMQLLGPRILMLRPGKGSTDLERVDIEGVRAKFGVGPEHVIDVLALTGDKTDNVPGVPGIGEKTAIPLIQTWGSIENLYEHLSEIPQKGVREKLANHRDLAFLSKRLVTIDTAVPLSSGIEDLRAQAPDLDRLIPLFEQLEFKGLIARVRKQDDHASVAPGGPADPGATRSKAAGGIVPGETAPEEPPPADILTIATDEHTYHSVTTTKDLKALCARLAGADSFAFDTETTSTDAMRAALVGCSFCITPREAWYIPVLQTPEDGGGELFPGSPSAPTTPPSSAGLPLGTVITALRPILEDPGKQIIGQNVKYDMLVMRRHGITMPSAAFDTMVAGYLLRADGQHSLDSMALDVLQYRMVSYDDLTGTGKNRVPITAVPVDRVAEYAAEDADFTMRLSRIHQTRLADAGMRELASSVEFPLITVLTEMEFNGVRVDTAFLAGMGKEIERQLQNLVADIHRHAGHEFNINSTQQLGEILFKNLHLPPVKKTKTGFSTDVTVLESLRGQHPIIDALLEYRQLSKLKSTYVDALPSLLHPETGRVHTSFNQTVAATGRLSSSDPNLQNIPIRTELGREIRRAFVPREPGWSILAADYSQIELRVMAHISGDAALREAFRLGEDIHATTAAKVFGVSPENVTKEMRRKAKEVNFGIMYGIGPFGLANRLGISQPEAKEIIARYFERFPGVKNYIHETLEHVRRTGYVQTLRGRRRYLPDIASKNQNIRGNAERQAINMPIQGTSADMIKIAMVNLSRALKTHGLKSRLLMQVHDELICEVPPGETERMRELVTQVMQEALPLDVPVRVDAGIGPNWLEAK
jgi:DNA polymerase-1